MSRNDAASKPPQSSPQVQTETSLWLRRLAPLIIGFATNKMRQPYENRLHSTHIHMWQVFTHPWSLLTKPRKVLEPLLASVG